MQTYAATNVRNLTPADGRRRDIDTGRRYNFLTLQLVLCALLTNSSLAAEPLQWQSSDEIAAVAERFLLERIGPRSSATSVKAGMLDGRLKLTACDEALQGFLRPGSKIGPKTIVGIRCNGKKPWKIYVPVEVVVRAEVWVARVPLPKGHLLGKEDLTADIRDISRMHAGYVSNAESLIGQRLKTSILAGRVVTLKLIEANNVVLRGQTVTLVVSAGGLHIRMSGKALMDGAVNQRIRVENHSSGRVVEGIVRSRELVEILVPTAAAAGPELLQGFSKKIPKGSATVADTPN